MSYLNTIYIKLKLHYEILYNKSLRLNLLFQEFLFNYSDIT